MRNDTTTRDQFVEYLSANLVRASHDDLGEFRRTFVAAYGVNGDSAFDKAFKKAKSQ